NNVAVRTAIFGFIAGAVAFLIFRQLGFMLLREIGVIKGGSSYSMAATKPFGVPSVVSLVFWTGLWGIVGTFVVPRLAGIPSVVGWILFAAIVPTLVNWFIVAPLKGAPLGNGFAMPGVVVAPLVYGFWGFGMWLVMRLLQQVTGKRAMA